MLFVHDDDTSHVTLDVLNERGEPMIARDERDQLHAPLESGDRVMVIGDDRSGLAIVSSRQAAMRAASISTADGSRPEVVPSKDGAAFIEVRANDGELLVQVDPVSKTVRIASEQTIQVESRTADLKFTAARRLTLQAGDVDIRARHGAAVQTGESKLAMVDDSLLISAPHTTVHANDAIVESRHVACISDRFEIRSRTLRFITDRIDSVADLVTSKAKTVLNTVTQTLRIQARHAQTIVDESSHHKAKTCYITAENAVKVQSEQIHLG